MLLLAALTHFCYSFPFSLINEPFPCFLFLLPPRASLCLGISLPSTTSPPQWLWGECEPFDRWILPLIVTGLEESWRNIVNLEIQRPIIPSIYTQIRIFRSRRVCTKIMIQLNPAARVNLPPNPAQSLKMSTKYALPPSMHVSRSPSYGQTKLTILSVLIFYTSMILIQAHPSHNFKVCFEVATWWTGLWNEACVLPDVRPNFTVFASSREAWSVTWRASRALRMSPASCTTF